VTTENHLKQAASFRDPNGFIFTRGGIIYRQVNISYRRNYDHLIGSGLYDQLINDGLLIPHQEVDTAPLQPEIAYKILIPEKIEIISYPYEWSFNQLKDAALTTLRIQKNALDFGMSLKDSSGYNIQFHKGHPVLIDSLSFEIYPEGKPWVAYRQFCQHFLAPLSLMAYKDIRLGNLLIGFIDGIPLDLTSRMLPFSSRLVPSLLIHIHMHASSQKRYAGEKIESTKGFNKTSLLGLIDSLETGIRRLRWSDNKTGWSNYYQDEQSYTEVGLAHKQQLVQEFISQIKPQSVWDLGANTGLYSRIASDSGAFTVAFDFDPAVVDRNYSEVVKRKETHLLPLLQDLTNPSPAIGWQNHERNSLIDRANAELVMALALIHHLIISNNVPLGSLATFFHSLSKWLIIEFIPKSDSQVQRLLAAREDIFEEYTREGFEKSFQKQFIIHRSEPIHDSSRILYLMESRS
jgi:hypothetical protein